MEFPRPRRVEHYKPELVAIVFTVKPGSGTGCPSGWLARMIGFSHQPSVLTLNGFLRQQLKRLENCANRGDNSRAMKSILVSIFGGLLLVGCATSKSLNLSSISIGMDKQKVIALKGEPFRVAAIDGLEYFIYRGFDLNRLLDGNGTFEAFIRFKDGKVEAYGRLGDFDSTKHKELLIKKSEKK